MLARHGIVSDPCVGVGILDLEKYSELSCCFTSYFDVTPLILSMKNVFIRFWGLDSRCRVLVNGSEVGVADSAHRVFTYDVKTKLVVGMNRVELRFDRADTDSEVSTTLGPASLSTSILTSRGSAFTGASSTTF